MAASSASGVFVAGCGEGVARGSAVVVCVAEAEAGSVTFACGTGGWVEPGAGAGGSADSEIVGSLDSGAGPVASEAGSSAGPGIWDSLDSRTVGCGGSTAAGAGGGVSLLWLFDDADVESDVDANDESPGMVIVDKRFALLRRLRFRPRPLRGGGVSGFVETGVAVVLPAALESLADVGGGPVLDDDENPGMPIAEKR